MVNSLPMLYPARSRWGTSWMLFQEGRSSNFRLRKEFTKMINKMRLC